jgi:hypothetical protein
MHRLFALENAVFVRCRGCGNRIDVWSPPDFRLDFSPDGKKGKLTLVDPAQALCPSCVVAAAPGPDRPEIERRFHELRVTAHDAGIPPSVTTYVLYTQGRPAVRWTKGFLLRTYAVHVPGWDIASRLRPHMTLTPDDPTRVPIPFVWFAAEVRHETVTDATGAYLEYIWPFDDLAQPALVRTIGFENPDLTDAQLATLNKGRRFLQDTIRRAGGRPAGSTFRNRDYYLDQYRALSRKLARPARQRDFLRHVEREGDITLTRATLKRNLEAFNLWPWDKFQAAAARVDNRR